MDPPLVSVCCITYNHEPYIRNAIEGFLMQETDFPFEIIIHDDASTDRTAEIVSSYTVQYPNIMKPIIQTENQYSKGAEIFSTFVFPKARGHYLALCEGDDYWTDKKKLQIQVGFLNDNNRYILSAHNATIINGNNKISAAMVLPKKKEHDYSSSDLAKGRILFPTASWVFRNISEKFPMEVKMVKNVDSFLSSFLGNFGDAKFHQEINPSVRRYHSGGVFSPLTRDQQNDLRMNTTFWLYYYYQKNAKSELAEYFLIKHLKSVLFGSTIRNILLYCLREILIRLLGLRKLKAILTNDTTVQNKSKSEIAP